MKLKYEYIEFLFIQKLQKTKVYECHNIKSGHPLGVVKWYPAWRRYCYFPTHEAVYSASCLDDISDFLKQINKLHKEQK